jgi:hypothetical protein
MFLTTAFAVVTVFSQEPTAAPKENPVHTAFQKSLAPYRDATALHLNGSMEIHLNPVALGETVEEGAPTLKKIGTITSTVRWAKPHYGSMKMQGAIDFMGFEQKIDVETLGTADGIYMAEHDTKVLEGPMGLDELGDPMMELEPFVSFMTGKTAIPAELKMLPADDAHAGMQGWSWTSDQGLVHTWMKNGIPVSIKIDMTQVNEDETETLMQRIVFNYSKVELVKEVEAKTYIAKLPEGYGSFDDESAGEVDDFESGLLAVGASAPNVMMTNMQDQQVSLASLQGKTVLLNFWFFN